MLLIKLLFAMAPTCAIAFRKPGMSWTGTMETGITETGSAHMGTMEILANTQPAQFVPVPMAVLQSA